MNGHPTAKFVNDQRTRLFDWRQAIADSDLPPTTKLVALVVSLHMNRAGESCFPGLELLQSQSSLCRAAVQNHLRKLAESRWLERRIKPGRGYATEYIATFPPQVVEAIIKRARQVGASEEAPTKRLLSAYKGPTQMDAIEEDVRTLGREDEKTSVTNVTGAAPRPDSSRIQSIDRDLTDSFLMGLVRTHLYVPDGKPPAGEDGGRDVTVIRNLRKMRQSGYQISAAIEGLAIMRDRGELDWLPPGTKCTMRALYNTRTGVRPLMGQAQDTYHKYCERRCDTGKPGPTLIGDVLKQAMQ